MASASEDCPLDKTELSTSGSAEDPTFPLFPFLPKELRLQIWESAVPRERLIRVSLKQHRGRRYELAAAEPRYLQRNALRKPISGERYRASVEGHKLNSKFLSVDSEAREVALRFYRIHIPMYFIGPEYTERTTLYINPEHDVLHIQADAPVKETLLDFLWDLKAYDPKDIGLLKLAVDLDSFCANDLQYFRPCDIFLIRQRAALVETLAQLNEVWFVHLQTPRKNLALPALLGIPEVTGLHANWALPVRGGKPAPAFERQGLDRRDGVEGSLERVSMGAVDPREIIFRWRRLLNKWGVVCNPELQYRLLVAEGPFGPRQMWEAGARELCTAYQTRKGTEGNGIAERHKMGGLHVDRDAPQRETATGFWLFPVEAVGEVQEGDKLADMDFSAARVLDLREFRPELVLTGAS